MKKIYGNQRQQQILKKYLENNLENLPNAILFSGESGIGKFETGREFAKQILGNEENFLKNFISVGEIWYEGCDEKKIPETTNLHFEHRKKLKKKNDEIGVDDIREIIKEDGKTSSLSKRVFLIKNIERFTTPASNTFLKTLEEAKNSVFICTTENRNLLLPTIISRFQSLEFSKLSNSEIKTFLEDENFSGNKEDVIKFSFGKIEVAKNFLEDENFLEEEKNFFEENKNFLENISYSQIYKKSDFIFKNKEKNKNLIKKEILFLENFLNSEGKIFFGEKKFLEVYKNFLELKKGLKSNQNLKLVFDNFYIGII